MAQDRRGEFSWRGFILAMARRLGLRTGPASIDPDLIDDIDRWSNAAPESIETALTQVLSELEDRALAVYAEAGLPTQLGHYARAPGDVAWQFVARNLKASDRWALVQEYPPEQGWRFATLQSLGLHQPEGDPSIEAAHVLTECQAVRDSREARHEATIILLERAIRLGMAGADLGRDPGSQRMSPRGPAVLPRSDEPGQAAPPPA